MNKDNCKLIPHGNEEKICTKCGYITWKSDKEDVEIIEDMINSGYSIPGCYSFNLEIFNQLYKLGISELNGIDKRVYGFLIGNLSGLSTCNSTSGDSIFLHKTTGHLMEYIIDTKLLKVFFNPIWHFLIDDLNISRPDAKELIRWWITHTTTIETIERIEAPYY